MELRTLVVAVFLFAVAIMSHEIETPSNIQRKSALSRRCAGAAAKLNRKRTAKRMATRAPLVEERYPGSGNATYEITTEAPYYDTLQNGTCVLTPEVTIGPYVWPQSQVLRQDMSEDQPGVPLWLDVGVLNMETCEPLPDALVSFWHCNATGSYSSFTGLSPNTPFLTLLSQLNISESDFQIGVTDLHTDATTFLRGMWPTDKEGMMEMKTIFPGFYVERSIHIHTVVYMNWSLTSNGTINSGNIAHIGQLFFDEQLESKIMSLEPYASHTEINRTSHADDSLGVYEQSAGNGYNPIMSVVPADGENVENGMIGYITIGIEPSAIQDVE